MLLKETISVFVRTIRNTNILCGQNAELQYLKVVHIATTGLYVVNCLCIMSLSSILVM
jgi:hypothetical protein